MTDKTFFTTNDADPRGEHWVYSALYKRLQSGDFDESDLAAARKVVAELEVKARHIVHTEGATDEFFSVCRVFYSWERVIESGWFRKAAQARQRAESIARFI